MGARPTAAGTDRPSQDRQGSQQDVAAPSWLTELLVPRKAAIDWRRAGRSAVAIGTPLAVGVATGNLMAGGLTAIGSLVGTVTSISGPYRDRARRTGFAVLAGAVGFLLGGLAGQHGWWTALLIVGAAVVSAVISAAGNNASLAGLQLLIYVILGTHESTLVSPWLAVGWYAVGATWALLLSLAGWPVLATAPERELVAAVFDRLAAVLTLSGTPDARAARHNLTAALNSAYDAVLTARSRMNGRDQVYRRLFVVLSDATPAIEASVALLSAHHRPPRSVVDAVRALAAAVRADRPPGDLDLPERGSPAVLTLVDGLRAVAAALRGDGVDERPDRRIDSRPTWRDRLGFWLDDVLAGPVTWRHAARLGLCMAVAEVVTLLVPLERSYWLALTVAIVLKPDFGSVFARAVQRGGGTLVGALLGGIVLAVNPNGWVLVAFAAAVAFLLPITQVRQFGMFSTTLTPLVIILLELGHPAGWDLPVARALDTLAGCLVVLVFGYLLWPGARSRPRIGGRLADAADRVAEYADLALRAGTEHRNAVRRRTYRQLTDLRTEFQRTLVEPSVTGRLATAWYPAIIGLERLTGSITGIAVGLGKGDPAPPDPDVDRIVAALHDVAAAVRAGKAPPDPPDVSAEQLATAMAHLRSVVSALRGPDLTDRRALPLVRRLLPRPLGLP